MFCTDYSANSDTAFDMLIPSYDNVLNELEVRKEACDIIEELPPEAKLQKLMPPIEDLEGHHHLSTNTVPNFKTLLYNTGVVSVHIRVTDQSSHATTSD